MSRHAGSGGRARAGWRAPYARPARPTRPGAWRRAAALKLQAAGPARCSAHWGWGRCQARCPCASWSHWARRPRARPSRACLPRPHGPPRQAPQRLQAWQPVMQQGLRALRDCAAAAQAAVRSSQQGGRRTIGLRRLVRLAVGRAVGLRAVRLMLAVAAAAAAAAVWLLLVRPLRRELLHLHLLHLRAPPAPPYSHDGPGGLLAFWPPILSRVHFSGTVLHVHQHHGHSTNHSRPSNWPQRAHTALCPAFQCSKRRKPRSALGRPRSHSRANSAAGPPARLLHLLAAERRQRAEHAQPEHDADDDHNDGCHHLRARARTPSQNPIFTDPHQADRHEARLAQQPGDACAKAGGAAPLGTPPAQIARCVKGAWE